MVDKKTIMADLDKVGAVIAEAKKEKKSLTSAQVEECRKTLKTATSELFAMRVACFKAGKGVVAKQAAIQKSITESLITKEDGQKEIEAATKAEATNQGRMQKIQSALDSVKTLVAEINTLAASPRLEELDKGHESSAQIGKPEQATETKTGAVTAKVKAIAPKTAAPIDRKAIIQKFIEARKAKAKTAGDATVNSHQDEKDPKGNLDENDHKDHMLGAPSDTFAQVITGMKEKGKRLYMAASEMLKKADAETDEAKKAMLLRRAGVLEKMGDSVAIQLEKEAKKIVTASTEKKSTDSKEAATVVFAANDQVLLADGVVGKISAVNGDKMMVNIAGVDREVLISSAKKITSGKTAAEKVSEAPVTVIAPNTEVVVEAPKANVTVVPPEKAPEKVTEKPVAKEGIAAKVMKAIDIMRTGGKAKKADAEVAVAKAPDAAKAAPASGPGAPVSAVDSKVIAFVDGIGWTVNVSANEVKSFGDDKAAAESFVKSSGLAVTAKEMMLDSASPKESGAAENIQSKIKGLDMTGKDYGTTKSEEKVNEQFSMIKKSTALTPGAPTDAATLTAPEQVQNQSKLKGLDQAGKDYGTTTKEQQVNPQFSAIARKNQILASTINEQKVRLSVVEAKLVVDRAVKVGAIAEAQRPEQETVLAELYRNSPAEFRAYDRLVANLEANSGKKDIGNRVVDRVKAAMEKKGSLVVEGSVGSSQSLDSGNFFED